MKSIYDASTRGNLINRISSLTQQNTAQWGKMKAFQMAKHYTLHEDMMLGNIKIERVLMRRWIGGMIFEKVPKDDRPFGKNSLLLGVFHLNKKTSNASGKEMVA